MSDQEQITGEKAYVMSTIHKAASPVISLRLAPVIIENLSNKRWEQVNVLLDDGNNRSIVSTRLADALELTGRQARLRIEGVAGKVLDQYTILTQVRISSLDKKFSKLIFLKALPNPCGKLSPIDWNDCKKAWPHISHIQFPECDYGKPVDIILGTDYPTIIASLEEIQGKDDLSPVARRTSLGWTAVGPVYPGTLHRDETELSTLIYSGEEPQFLTDKSIENYLSWSYMAVDRWASTNMQPHDNVYSFRDIPSFYPGQGSLKTFPTGEGVYFGASLTSAQKERKKTTGTTPKPKAPGVRESNRILEYWLQRMYNEDRLPGDNDPDKALSREEQQALDGLNASRRMRSDGHYQVAVMWKTDEPALTTNLTLALNRLRKLELGKHLRTQENKDDYFSVFEGWIEKGYIIPVPRNEINCNESYYLPHFPVKRDDKTTSKVRPVLDGAATYAGKCLNDSIHVGPKLINDLCVVLLRFRKDYVAIGGDVSEMFLQIYMEERDQKYHRIVFRKDAKAPIEHYQFQVHPFGNRGSPCVAIFVIKAHARDNALKWPRAAETVLESTLVDDNLDSVATEEEALQLIDDLKLLYGSCGMNIKKFISNSSKVLASLPEEDRAKDIDLAELKVWDSANMPLVKTLGVIWLAAQDHFTFASTIPDLEQTWTKRLCLQTSCRLYDPLGFLAPYTVRARMEGQAHWQLHLDWDDPLPPESLYSWKEWVNELADLPQIRVPRCLKGDLSDKVIRQTLHVFCDASEKAFAAVVYIVNETTNTKKVFQTKFVMGKARAAPIQHLTIPRMELKAAVLAVDLIHLVNKALNVALTDIHFWTDSLNVLCWIKTTTRQLDRFVANRVQQILNQTLVENWHWVSTKENPADIASRGEHVAVLAESTLWWKGPDFISQSPKKWPDIPPTSVTYVPPEGIVDLHGEGKLYHYLLAFFEPIDLSSPNMSALAPEYHSSFTRLLRTVSCVLYLLYLHKSNLLKSRQKDPKVCISYSDQAVYEFAFNWVIRQAQAQTPAIQEAAKTLLKKDQVSRDSALVDLQPQLDQNGILRVGGRISSAKHLTFEERCPIILEGQHPLSKLIVLHFHDVVLRHGGGPNHTLSEIHRTYWLLGGRKLVHKLVPKCTICKRVQAKEQHQRMAPLPNFRIPNPKDCPRVFNTCGIDCAGPFLTKQGQRRSPEKRYMLLFTCTLIRAVHIEMLYHLDVPSFLHALSRFLARRPRPKAMVSDNGTNFVGANADIIQLWTDMQTHANFAQVRRSYPEIKWLFNTPTASHTGGVFERMIGAAKSAFYKTVGRQDLNDEELVTTFTIVEGILNSRPLTVVSPNSKDLRAITPAHFLGLREDGVNTGLDVVPIPEERFYRARWHEIQKLMDDFWIRFVGDMLVKLQAMPKWHRKRSTPVPGQVVLVLEKKHRGIWPLGRILECYPSADGLVRTVKVAIPSRSPNSHVNEPNSPPSELNRPIHKIIPLDMLEFQEEDDDVDKVVPVTNDVVDAMDMETKTPDAAGDPPVNI